MKDRIPGRLARLGPGQRWGLLALALLLAAALLAAWPKPHPPSSAAPAAAGPGLAQRLAPAAQATPAGTWNLDEPASSAGGWSAGTSVILALVAVLGLLYGSLWLLRRFNPQARLAGGQAGLLRLQTSLRLGPNQALHLVQFGAQSLLIGASPAGIVLLGQAPAGEGAAAAGSDFASVLQDRLKEGAA